MLDNYRRERKKLRFYLKDEIINAIFLYMHIKKHSIGLKTYLIIKIIGCVLNVMLFICNFLMCTLG